MKILLILLLAFSLTSSQQSMEYCDGWTEGYKRGWCYYNESNGLACIEPIPPICPIPKLNATEYIDGYNRGFLRGVGDWENK